MKTGEIIVFTGLLNFVENHHQLVAVLSHELAHIILEHGVTTLCFFTDDNLYRMPTSAGNSQSVDCGLCRGIDAGVHSVGGHSGRYDRPVQQLVEKQDYQGIFVGLYGTRFRVLDNRSSWSCRTVG